MIILRKPGQQSSPSVAVAQTLTGSLDGVNKIFQTPHEYEPSRISLMYNGQSLHSPEDFEETDTNEVRLIYITPFEDDILRATYEYLGGTSGGGGTTVHGELSGLSADDHPQYHNNTRGDARYYTKAEIDSMIGNQRYGQESIPNGAEDIWVPISPAFSSANYSISISIENTSDSPTSIYSYNITAKTVNGFEVTFTGDIDSSNYILSWIAVS